MSSETDAQIITLSDVAVAKVREVMAAQPLAPEERNLRIFVEGGGCGGPAFGLAFDSAQDGDESFETAGMTVLVDPVSRPYVEGVQIDYVETPEVTGFKVTAPNTVAGCASSGCSPSSCGQAAPSGGCGHSH